MAPGGIHDATAGVRHDVQWDLPEPLDIARFREDRFPRAILP